MGPIARAQPAGSHTCTRSPSGPASRAKHTQKDSPRPTAADEIPDENETPQSRGRVWAVAIYCVLIRSNLAEHRSRVISDDDGASVGLDKREAPTNMKSTAKPNSSPLAMGTQTLTDCFKRESTSATPRITGGPPQSLTEKLVQPSQNMEIGSRMLAMIMYSRCVSGEGLCVASNFRLYRAENGRIPRGVKSRPMQIAMKVKPI